MKIIGIMICDGECGSSVTKGLWRCWCYRDIIWAYKYKRYKKRKNMDNYDVYQQTKHNNNNDDESKDIIQCIVNMAESIIALAGEYFLEEVFKLFFFFFFFFFLFF